MNEFQIDFYWIFRIIFHLSNQTIHKFSNWILTNFERIQHLKNLTPPYSWSRIESNEFRINFHRIFRIFFALSNQSNRKFSNRIERISNEFQFDSTPTHSWKSEVLNYVIVWRGILPIKLRIIAFSQDSHFNEVQYSIYRVTIISTTAVKAIEYVTQKMKLFSILKMQMIQISTAAE